MIPTVLVGLPPLNAVVGTHDIDEFESWWVSDPFPVDVEKIYQIVHVMGDYYILVAKLVGGGDVLLRSNSDGRSWELIWDSVSRIYDLNQLEQGWLLIATDEGWFETFDIGSTIDKVSDTGPSRGKAMLVADDLIFVTDGFGVWSADPSDYVWTKIYDPDPGWSGLSYPNIIGDCEAVYVSIGPRLIRSDDQGSTWETVAHRGNSNIIHTLIRRRLSQEDPYDVIAQEERTNEDLYRYYKVTSRGSVWTAMFNQAYSPGATLDGDGIISVFGSPENLYFNGGTRFDPDLGRFVPRLRWSLDGEEWTDIDLSKTHTSPSTPFLVKTWTECTTVYIPCCTYKTVCTEVKWRYRFHVDSQARLRKTFETGVDTSVGITLRREKPTNASGRFLKTVPTVLEPKSRFQKEILEVVPSSTRLMKELSEPVDVSAWNRVTRGAGIDGSYRAKRVVPARLTIGTTRRGEVSKGFNIDAIFVKSYYDQILVDSETYFPQYWRLHIPEWPWHVFDSRKVGSF